MTDPNYDAESAFPVPDHQDRWGTTHATATGMTLRDYFAAKAMQALVARVPYGEQCGMYPTALCVAAFNIADAMLKARHD